VRARLKRLASWHTDNDADAADLVQRALTRVFDPEGSPWDPEGGQSFFLHVGSILNSIAANEWRSARARHEIVDNNVARDEGSVDGTPLADRALEEHQEREELRRRGTLLLERLGDQDSVAREVILASREGCETPAEQAAHIGRDVGEVYEAYRRLKYLAGRIREEAAAEEERMRGRPKRATREEVAR
jgi:DNA-directed RNA polymerase specialized sigma24 family protein